MSSSINDNVGNTDDTNVHVIQTPLRKRYTHYHLSTFLLTFFSYAMLHAARKVFSNVKSTMAEEWSPLANETLNPIKPDDTWNKQRLYASPEDATVFLGVLDAVFMFSYSAGLFISGIIGDRFDLRIVLCFGMIVTSIMIFCFGVLSEWLQIYSIGWYVSFWILNGLAQSTGWPCVVAIMGNWFGKEGRGLIFGIWSACASVGNIFGAILAAAFLKYGYDYAFLVCCILLICCATVCFFAIVPSPADVGLEIQDGHVSTIEAVIPQSTTINDCETGEATEVLVRPDELAKNKPVTFFRAWLLPGVAMYSLCYACLKLVNYSFFFWLPFYLRDRFSWRESDSNLLSTLYDVGGIIGGIVGGLLSDLIASRSIVVIPSLLFAIPTLFIFSNLADNKLLNGIVMTITGVFIGGPANMISAAITADLGRQEILAASDKALSTVTGIVDGTGSFGAAIGQVLIPVIQEAWDNWRFVFYFFILMTFITCLCILPLFIRECKIAFNKIKTRFSAGSQTNYDTLE
jgi:OPA family glycerol-3-phosphate transporter-like MFS transporter 3